MTSEGQKYELSDDFKGLLKQLINNAAFYKINQDLKAEIVAMRAVEKPKKKSTKFRALKINSKKVQFSFNGILSGTQQTVGISKLPDSERSNSGLETQT